MSQEGQSQAGHTHSSPTSLLCPIPPLSPMCSIFSVPLLISLMSAPGTGQRDGGGDPPSGSVRWPSLQANEHSTGFSAGCQLWALCAGNILSKMSPRTSQQCPADGGQGAAGLAICLQPLRGNYIRVSQVLVQGGCQMLFPSSTKAISIFSVLAELHIVTVSRCERGAGTEDRGVCPMKEGEGHHGREDRSRR